MIDEMSLVQLKSFKAYWTRHPPVHLLVASYIGYKPQENDPSSEQEQPDLDAFIQESMKIHGAVIEPGTF